MKHTQVAATNIETIISNTLVCFMVPSLRYAIKIINTSKTVINTPYNNGIPNKISKEMAVPTTSAKSVAIIAISAQKYMKRFNFGSSSYDTFQPNLNQ